MAGARGAHLRRARPAGSQQLKAQIEEIADQQREDARASTTGCARRRRRRSTSWRAHHGSSISGCCRPASLAGSRSQVAQEVGRGRRRGDPALDLRPSQGADRRAEFGTRLRPRRRGDLVAVDQRRRREDRRRVEPGQLGQPVHQPAPGAVAHHRAQRRCDPDHRAAAAVGQSSPQWWRNQRRSAVVPGASRRPSRRRQRAASRALR